MLSSFRKAALLALGLTLTACATDRAPTATVADTSSVSELKRLQAQEQVELARLAGQAAIADSIRANPSLLGGLLGTVTGTVSGTVGTVTGTVGTLTETVVETLNSPLLVCNPLEFASDVRIIGPAGGTLKIGPHRLVIPAGALKQNTVVSGEIPLLSLTPSVSLKPHGLKFERPVELTLSYEHCLLNLGRSRSVVYTDDDLNILEWPKSTDSRTKHVTGYIWHFSRYAVARGSNYAVAW
jgi:hypothetical protein